MSLSYCKYRRSWEAAGSANVPAHRPRGGGKKETRYKKSRQVNFKTYDRAINQTQYSVEQCQRSHAINSARKRPTFKVHRGFSCSTEEGNPNG